MAKRGKLVLGVDVGTGSARAALFDLKGHRQGMGVSPIKMWKPRPRFAEQSSTNIWKAVCRAVQAAMREAKAKPGEVGSLGFDATCSLVVLDREGDPLTVSPTREAEQNVIVWMDHRAIPQAERINATRHKVLRYVGGTISPEMQPPKLLWLKENLPRTFAKAGFFLDLPDFLTFRATGVDIRSLCTTVCKWTYQGHARTSKHAASFGKWDGSFWEKIGIEEFPREDFVRIGRVIRPMGEPVGTGLTRTAAKELGLQEGTPVGVALIDAHAGGIGMLGAPGGGGLTAARLERTLALIGGTSSCHMAVSREAKFVPGVWGPYYSAMVPEMWLTEGGQSATGALIDHVLFSHRRSVELEKEAKRTGSSVYTIADELVHELARVEGLDFPAGITAERHVLPYFHGNRSPRADPSLKGAVWGLTLDNSVEDLVRTYYATVQAIAYGTRHIIETVNARGYHIEEIVACGGGTKSNIYLGEHADATGCPIVIPREPEAVLLGAAMLGAVAAEFYPDLPTCMGEMNAMAERIKPAGGPTASYHDKKYKVFHQLYKDFTRTRKLMKDA